MLRSLLKFIFFVVLFLVSVGAYSQKINVKDWGAKGDGMTDDYLAIKKVVEQINKAKGGEVYFPPGTYLINRYNDAEIFEDLEYKNCDGLVIHGNNATISVKGDIKRRVTKKVGKRSFSNVSSIIPIRLTNCKNVKITNLEINGNVDKMTRDVGVVEARGYLIYISDSENIELRDLYLHHAHTDGLLIRGTKKPSFNLKAYNLISAFNARQGMSIGHLYEAQFVNCKFINTGFSTGTYGKHAPGAGVDIEPVLGEVIKVKNLIFEKCTFSNNSGSQFIVSSPKLTIGIMLKDCTIEAGKSKSRFTMILAARDVVVSKCNIKCGMGDIYPVWGGMPNGSVKIIGCEIESASRGIVSDRSTTSEGIYISENTLKFTGRSLPSYFPYLQNSNTYFRDNRIYIPYHSLGNRKVHSLIQNAKESSGNLYYTGDENKKPKVSYNGTGIINDK